MLNIFYRDEHLHGRMSGPKKVIENLIRSLEDMNVAFSINQEKYENNLFLHWDPYHIQRYQSLRNKEKLLVGPQVWPFSPDFESLTEYGKVITPSKWVEELYKKHFSSVKTLIWPVAIYPPEIEDDVTTDCLVYYKNRPAEDLQSVLEFLDKRGISYTGLEYGNYSQEEFKESLSSVKFCVIIDNTESQGIAIQEMMALNKPLFVWDQTIWDHMGSDYKISSTSIPYWSNECGEYVKSFDEFEDKFEKFQKQLNEYCPIDFIIRELSPQKSVQILTEYYAS